MAKRAISLIFAVPVRRDFRKVSLFYLGATLLIGCAGPHSLTSALRFLIWAPLGVMLLISVSENFLWRKVRLSAAGKIFEDPAARVTVRPV